MNSVVLLDTGPLVASLYSRDQHHLWVKQITATLLPPFLTCEPVLTEACFLMQRLIGDNDAVLELVADNLIQVAFSLNNEVAAVKSLMTRYSDIPMSLADACLVRMSELYPDCILLTTDSDFTIYRRSRRKIIPTLMPPALS
jgi:predicted nucleic acid-binding protein